MKHSSGSLWLVAVCMLLSVGCDKEASVGTDPGDCYEGVRCEELFFDIRYEDMLTISSREGVEALAPTWTLDELGGVLLGGPDAVVGGVSPLTGHAPGAFARVALALGPERGLWAFARGPENLHAWELSASGAVLREATFTRPERVPGEEATYNFCNVQSHPKGPVVTVGWREACSKEEGICGAIETLVFQESLEREPERPNLEFTGQAACGTRAFRNTVGDALIVEDFYSLRVREVSLSGETLWEQLVPRALLAEYGIANGHLDSSGEWITGLVASPIEYAGQGGAVLVFLRVSEQDVSLTFGDVSQEFSFNSPLQRPPRMLFDSEGRLLVLTVGGTQSYEQNLWILRSSLDGSPGKAVAITREDYLPLLAGPASVDPEGNIYVAMNIGGPRPERQDAILCQVRESFDEARCFYIDAVPSALEVSEEGVVYTASPAGIQRYDLP